MFWMSSPASPGRVRQSGGISGPGVSNHPQAETPPTAPDNLPDGNEVDMDRVSRKRGTPDHDSVVQKKPLIQILDTTNELVDENNVVLPTY